MKTYATLKLFSLNIGTFIIFNPKPGEGGGGWSDHRIFELSRLTNGLIYLSNYFWIKLQFWTKFFKCIFWHPFAHFLLRATHFGVHGCTLRGHSEAFLFFPLSLALDSSHPTTMARIARRIMGRPRRHRLKGDGLLWEKINFIDKNRLLTKIDETILPLVGHFYVLHFYFFEPKPYCAIWL